MSGHVYIGGRKGARALQPHVDDYDVFVLQLVGAKEWTICTARAAELNSTMPHATSADHCQYHHRLRQEATGAGGGQYDERELQHNPDYACSTVVLQGGDTLYLPKGTIHYANAGDDASVHLTLALWRVNVTMDSLLGEGISRLASDNAAHAAHTMTRLATLQPFGLVLGSVVPGLRAIVSRPSSQQAMDELAAHYRGLVDIAEAAGLVFFGASGLPTGFKDAVSDLRSLDAVDIAASFLRKTAQNHQRLRDPVVFHREITGEADDPSAVSSGPTESTSKADTTPRTEL